EHFVFLLSCKAGGVGLNLVGASRLVLFDLDWNPATDSQTVSRIWREGQKRPVFIYRLVMAGTIEEKIYQRQLKKEGLAHSLGGTTIGQDLFSVEELKDLFALNHEEVSETQQALSKRLIKDSDVLIIDDF